jgi:glutathione S-transferase
MILIGQFDSPFTRRIGIALKLYGLEFEHRPWSVFGDADLIRPLNPLTRVPTLQLESGLALVETGAILDYLDGMVPPEARLYPQAQPARAEAMRVAGLASGLSDKAVALFYELRLHAQVSDFYVERCAGQIRGTIAALEADRAARATPFWFGDRLGHADIAVVASLRHLVEAHPGLVNLPDFSALAQLCAECEAKAVFREISQPFIAPSV